MTVFQPICLGRPIPVLLDRTWPRKPCRGVDLKEICCICASFVVWRGIIGESGGESDVGAPERARETTKMMKLMSVVLVVGGLLFIALGAALGVSGDLPLVDSFVAICVMAMGMGSYATGRLA